MQDNSTVIVGTGSLSYSSSFTKNLTLTRTQYSPVFTLEKTDVGFTFTFTQKLLVKLTNNYKEMAKHIPIIFVLFTTFKKNLLLNK